MQAVPARECLLGGEERVGERVAGTAWEEDAEGGV